jgi:hypothetical protein
LPQLRYGTQQAHLSSLKRWIRPRLGRCFLDQVKAMEVEQWLRSLQLAPKSKVNLRSLLHLVFQHGRRWEITDVNPREWARRRRKHLGFPFRGPRFVSPSQIPPLRSPHSSPPAAGLSRNAEMCAADLAKASTQFSRLDLPLEYALLPASLARAVRIRRPRCTIRPRCSLSASARRGSTGRRYQSPTRTGPALDHSEHDECLYASDAGR